MSDSVNISQRTVSVDKAPIFEPYSKVIIHAGLSQDGKTEIIYTAGDDTGRTLEVNNEWGTQAMANNILARIKGYQYQPLTAQGAHVDPSVELGDGITVNGIYSGIFVQATTFNKLMKSNVSAPVDEEIEHEYGFESQTNRAFTRMVAQTRTGITQNEHEIQLTAEELRHDVLDPDNPESLKSQLTLTATTLTSQISQETRDREQAISTLSSEFTQTANAISASVTAEENRAKAAEDTKLDHTHTAQSFGWELTSTNFLLKNNNQTVFQFDKDGLAFLSGGTKVFTVDRTNGLYVKGNGEFTGKITASSGTIGGITIVNNALYTNGKTGIDTAVNGVHISSSGISLGNNGFKVDYNGNVTMKRGSINIADKFIVSSAGAVTMNSGSINIADKFQVTSAGAVSATNLSITGGSININNGAFYVNSSGQLTAKSGTFEGNIYAKNIKYSDGSSGSSGYGTLSGSAITTGTINGSANGTRGQINSSSIGGGDIAYRSISGGSANGHIMQNTLTDYNVLPNSYSGGGLSTNSLASTIGTSLGYADLFGNAKTTSSRLDYFKSAQLVATTSVYSPKYWCADTSGGTNEVNLVGHYHSFTESQGKIILGAPHNDSATDRHSFKIADTQAYKDGVAAIGVTSLSYSSWQFNSDDLAVQFTSAYTDYTNGSLRGRGIITLDNGKTRYCRVSLAGNKAYDAGKESVTVTVSDSGVTWNRYYSMYYYGAVANASNGESASFTQYFNPTEAIQAGYDRGYADGQASSSGCSGHVEVTSASDGSAFIKVYDNNWNLVGPGSSGKWINAGYSETFG